LAVSVPTRTKHKKETASTKLMVVIMERKNRTRILFKLISRDFIKGSTTCLEISVPLFADLVTFILIVNEFVCGRATSAKD
jgi:hypothetical protein